MHHFLLFTRYYVIFIFSYSDAEGCDLFWFPFDNKSQLMHKAGRKASNYAQFAFNLNIRLSGGNPHC